MRKKLIALLLCFVMISSSGLFTNFVTAADESSQSSDLENVLDESQENAGMVFGEEDFQKFEINLEPSNPFISEEIVPEPEIDPTVDSENEEDIIGEDDTSGEDTSVLENPTNDDMKIINDGEIPLVTMTLYEQFMACKSLDELDAVFAITSDEDWNNFTDEERAAITDLLMELKQAPTSETVFISSEPPVKSEIVFPAVNFTNVAPFKDAVIGGN